MKNAQLSFLSGAILAAHKPALQAELADTFLTAHATLLEDGADQGVWIQLMPAGTFSGRDGRGPFVAGNREQLATIAAQTRAYLASTDLLVDYEHQSLNAEKNGKPNLAAGWVKEFEPRDDGLYGKIEWTASAAAAIKAKEYRYLSPVFFHTKAGKILALQTVALTNTPNLNIAEISAHSIFQARTQEENMDKILAALGLAAGASENDVLMAINSLLTSSTAIAVAAGLTKDAKSEEVVASVNSAFADRKAIAKALGQAETASGDTLTGALTSAMKAGNPDPTKFVPIEQVSAMQADLKALKDQVGGDKAEAAVDAAIRDGKVVPALREWAISMHKADPAKFEEFVGKSPVLTSAQRSVTANPPGKKDGAILSEEDETVIAAMGLSREDYAKTIAAETAGGN